MFIISIAHESEVPANLKLEKDMDIFNNTVGQDVGDDLSNLLASKSSLSEQIFVKLLNGELRYIAPLDFQNYFHGLIPNVSHLKPTDQ